MSEYDGRGLREGVGERWRRLVGAASGRRLVVETERTVTADPRQNDEDVAEHGDHRLTVRVGALPDGFYVEDDGPGIPEDEREVVFEAGHTTDRDGIGMGLTFVVQLVEAYGWHCTVTDGADGGARFEFTAVGGVSSGGEEHLVSTP